jgi:hypothetical protein
MVTIKGSRSPESKIAQKNYYYQELYWGPFSRSIILPEDVEADGAKAAMKNGILTKQRNPHWGFLCFYSYRTTLSELSATLNEPCDGAHYQAYR